MSAAPVTQGPQASERPTARELTRAELVELKADQAIREYLRGARQQFVPIYEAVEELLAGRPVAVVSLGAWHTEHCKAADACDRLEMAHQVEQRVLRRASGWLALQRDR